MGAVYVARDEATGERVAVKRLLDTRHADRFEIEGRLLSYFDHPRVVRVRDHFREPSGHYLVMDLVEGTDLARLLRERGAPGLDPAEAVRRVREACEALQYVHDHQVVHRDVKPQNLILGREGVVLVDFGIAREMALDDDGTVGIGTPHFMAPEVLGGGAASPRSDVYGAAATLWTLLAGRPPVYGDSARADHLLPAAAGELRATLREGLEAIPERRIGSAASFAAALGAPLDPGGRGRPLVSSVERPRAPRRLLEAVVRTAAGVFEAAASSIALAEPGGGLVYEAAWGAGADEIVGVRLARGEGIAGAALASADGVAVADCRADERFAARVAEGTGHVPFTMLVVPLVRDGAAIGVLSLLDRRDGRPYGPDDIVRGELFAELAVSALGGEAGEAPGAGATAAAPPVTP